MKIRGKGSLWPSARVGHSSVFFGNRYLAVFGGCNSIEGEDRYMSLQEFYLYDIIKDKWITIHCNPSENTEVPPGLSSSATWLVDNLLYMFGGFTEHGQINSFYVFSFDTFAWKMLPQHSKTPSPKDKSVTWVHNNKLYLFGGYGPQPDVHQSSFGSHTNDEDSFLPFDVKSWNNHLHIYNPSTPDDGWKVLKPKGVSPLPRAACGSAVLDDGRVFIFGGRNQTLRMNDLHCLNLKKEEWSGSIETITKPIGRSWHVLCTLNSVTMFLYGGYSTSGDPLGDCWLLHVSPYTDNMRDISVWWQEIKPSYDLTSPLEYTTHFDEKPIAGRLWHSGVSTPDGEVLVFGGTYSRVTEPLIYSNQLIKFYTSAKSLCRLCQDACIKHHDTLEPLWPTLPTHLVNSLRARIESVELLGKRDILKSVCSLS